MADDLTSCDFFHGAELVEDPYLYFEALRSRCPVSREPHHDFAMVRNCAPTPTYIPRGLGSLHLNGTLPMLPTKR